MLFDEKKDKAVKSFFSNISYLDKEGLICIRKQEQKKLLSMSEQCLVSNISFYKDENLLIQSIIVDELLLLEENYGKDKESLLSLSTS